MQQSQVLQVQRRTLFLHLLTNCPKGVIEMDHENFQISLEAVRRVLPGAVQAYLGNQAGTSFDPRSVSIPLIRDPDLRVLLDGAIRDHALDAVTAEDIYDVAGNLLFRDFVLTLTADKALRIRTGANKALGAVVISLSLGPPTYWAHLMSEALSYAERSGLGRAEEPTRVVCYAYPRLGVPVVDQDGQRSYVDLLEPKLATVSLYREAGEGDNTWKPLNAIASEAVQGGVKQFEVEASALSARSAPAEDGSARGAESDSVAFEKCIPLPLLAQQGDNWCALASAQMILKGHGIEVAQEEIGAKMDNMEIINIQGTRPKRQAAGLDQICTDKGLVTTLIDAKAPEINDDWDRALPLIVREITNNRPVQRQLDHPMHVDVIAGVRGVVGSSDFMLRILDPRKPEGEERWDRWNLVKSNIHNLILLHPPEEKVAAQSLLNRETARA